MPTSIVMPKLGMTMKEGKVEEWVKSPGDPVTKGEGIAVISSEKLTNEVETPVSGVLLEIAKDVNEDVPVGEVIGIVGEESEKVNEAPSPPQDEPARTIQVNTTSSDSDQGVAVATQVKHRIRISPAARKKATELDIDPQDVTGTGPKGRVTRRDIEKAAEEYTVRSTVQISQATKPEQEAQPDTQPEENPPKNGESLSSMRQTIAKRMHESLTSTAQLTLHRKADIQSLLEFQTRISKEASESGLDVKLSLTALLSRAVTLSLQDFPIMNTHLIHDQLHPYDEVHLGIATALEEGLMVPVVSNAERLSLRELSKEIRLVTEKSREGTVDGAEITGSTFTITNLGSQGVEYFTPILNTPESGILGVGTSIDELKLVEDEVVQTKKLPLSLTFDHRVVDGAPAAQFLDRVTKYLEHPYLLVL